MSKPEITGKSEGGVFVRQVVTGLDIIGWIMTSYFFWIKSETWSVTETFRFCSSSGD